MNVQIKMLEGCEDLVPSYGTEGAAGMDVKSSIDFILVPGRYIKIPLGFSIKIPEGYVGFLVPRSGLAFKHAINIVNSPGTIDSDYLGEVCALLHREQSQLSVEDDYYGLKQTTRTEAFLEFKRGDRIGQLVIVPFVKAKLELVDRLETTERGDGGFGSTGLSREKVDMTKHMQEGLKLNQDFYNK